MMRAASTLAHRASCPSPSLPQPWSSAWARDLSPYGVVGPCGLKGGL